MPNYPVVNYTLPITNNLAMPLFDLLHKDKNSHARAGIIHTDHGDIETPMFMAVGTQASVKTLDQTDLKNINAQIILGNTYHLHLRPGEDVIAEQGGLHKFMNWDRPILTDSGGFQVFSLGLRKDKKTKSGFTDASGSTDTNDQVASVHLNSSVNPDLVSKDQGRLVEIDEDGVTFRSYIDGSTHRFTPETAIEIQYKLGADIIMAFDECTPDDAEENYARTAMERTHRWAERSLAAHRKPPSRGAHGGCDTNASSVITANWRRRRLTPPLPPSRGGLAYRQFLFGIIQGSNYKHLREESARFISSLDFDGIAIGGESIGYNMKATAEILDWVYPLIPIDKPHYAMGVGLSPVDMLIAVEHGVDIFDCVAPTRLARHGMVFIFDKKNKHRLNLKNAQYTTDTNPIDSDCECTTCQNYSRSYLHHLFAANEITGLRLASIHNLFFMINIMRQARIAIQENRFRELKDSWI